MEFDLENPFQHSHSVSSLFLAEPDHIPSRHYFLTLHSAHFHLSLRTRLISLISQLPCTFDPLLSYLAINYLDRFLASQVTLEQKPWTLKLLAVSCLSLAAKMIKTEFSVTDVQAFLKQGDGGIIFETQTVQRMEALILGALQWRMRSITPFSFIPFFITLFMLKDPPLRQVLKDRAAQIIFKSQREIKLLEFKPSIIAASALLYASHELFPFQYPCFLSAISDCPHVNKETMLQCYNVIRDIAMEGYESVLDMVSSSDTPVNVLDHHFLSSESERTDGNPAAATTLRQEKDLKRRKINDCGDNLTAHISQA
ncbi:putative cyclin-D6-1 [Prosopis cineraria]|uniref:putative cyclin-D6-1 n=1 Tax=Prosopis cineraria TaxID=364024 RepID=UPI00241009FF|nr:putative cyclin-D6-1 [Prosopis cineraria]